MEAAGHSVLAAAAVPRALSQAVQLGQPRGGELSQTIKLREVLPGSFDLCVEVDAHAAILNARPGLNGSAQKMR